MSTSRAIPILRTADLDDAYGAVERLLHLVNPLDGFRVSAEAQALTLAEAQAMASAFPEALLSPSDVRRPESIEEIRALIIGGDARAHEVLPVTLVLSDKAVGSIEDAFFSIIGTGTASIDWSWFSWPAVPELDLEPSAEDACLQIVINSRDVLSEIPAADHTVFLHHHGEDTPWAEWVAGQVGQKPIGPWESGW